MIQNSNEPMSISEEPSSGANSFSLNRPYTSSTQGFSDFVKEQIGIFGTIVSSLPILTDYLKIVTIPSPYITFFTTVLCASIFFTLFWDREKIIKKQPLKSVFYQGLFWVVIGIVALLFYAEYEPFVPLNNIDSSSHANFVHIIIITGYVAGFASMVYGISLISIYGFVREAERFTQLQRQLALITPEQWVFVRDLIYSLADITRKISDDEDDEILQPAKEGLQDVARYFYEKTSKMFEKMDKQVEIVVPGPGPYMDAICTQFLQKARGTRALSYDDLDFWKDPIESQKYLARFEGIPEQERIFIFPKDRLQELIAQNKLNLLKRVLDIQVTRGIKIGLVLTENLPSNVPGNTLDFCLLDTGRKSQRDSGFATFFWRGERGPIYRDFAIRLDRVQNQEYSDIYEEIKKHTVKIDPQGPDRTLIGTVEKLNDLLELLRKQLTTVERK